MTDLSDGIAKDVLGLLPKGTQAHLELSSIPVAEDADNLYSALTDGEDYELLFTLAPRTIALRNGPSGTSHTNWHYC